MDDLEEIKRQIELARTYGKYIHESRARLAGVLSGAPGIAGSEVEFPEPDIMHVYQCMFGRRVGEAIVYRLSFSNPIKWIGVSHPWGLKPADIPVPADWNLTPEAR